MMPTMFAPSPQRGATKTAMTGFPLGGSQSSHSVVAAAAGAREGGAAFVKPTVAAMKQRKRSADFMGEE